MTIDARHLRIKSGRSGISLDGDELTSGEKVGCELYTTSIASMPPSSNLTVPFGVGSEIRDDDSMHDENTNPERVTVPEDGWYTCSGWVQWPTNANGYRQLDVSSAGGSSQTVLRSLVQPYSTQVTRIPFSGDVYLEAGDYVTVTIGHTSDSSLTPAAMKLCVTKK